MCVVLSDNRVCPLTTLGKSYHWIYWNAIWFSLMIEYLFILNYTYSIYHWTNNSNETVSFIFSIFVNYSNILCKTVHGTRRDKKLWKIGWYGTKNFGKQYFFIAVFGFNIHDVYCERKYKNVQGFNFFYIIMLELANCGCGFGFFNILVYKYVFVIS